MPPFYFQIKIDNETTIQIFKKKVKHLSQMIQRKKQHEMKHNNERKRKCFEESNGPNDQTRTDSSWYANRSICIYVCILFRVQTEITTNI